MKKIFANDTVGLLVRVSLGILFIWASVDKILHPADFAKIVNNYQILPGELVNIFAVVLPWLEFLCGLALLTGILVRPAAAWAGVLLTLFIAVVSVSLARGLNINCGCFSTSSQARNLGFGLLAEDFGMLLLAIHAFCFDCRRWSPARSSGFRPWTVLKRKRFYGLLVAVGFLVYSFWGIDLAGAWAAIREIRPWYLIPVILGVFLMPLTRAQRLKIIFAQEKKIDGWHVFSVYNIAQLLNISLPALTGQVARVLIFSRMFSLTKTFSFTIVVLEVLFDGLTLLMFVFAASSLVVFPDWLVRGEVVILVACILLFGFFYFVLHRQDRSSGRLPRWMHRLPLRWVREWLNVYRSFLAGLRMLKSGRHLLLAVIFSLASWLAHAVAVFSLIYAFGFDLPFWGALVILIVNTAIIMVPISPGNLGTFQFACILGLSFFGIPKESALSFSLVLHAVETLPVLGLGLYYSFAARIRLKEYQTPEVLREQEYLATQEYPFEAADGDGQKKPSPEAEEKTKR